MPPPPREETSGSLHARILGAAAGPGLAAWRRRWPETRKAPRCALLTLDGEWTLRTGESRVRAFAGTLLLLGRGHTCRAEPGRPDATTAVRWCWVAFAGGLAQDVADEIIRVTGGRIHVDPRGAAAMALSRLATPSATVGSATCVLHDALTWTLEEAVAHRVRLRAALLAPGPEAAVAASRAGLAELADVAGYSKNHLALVLRRRWGETPAALLRRERLRIAAEALRRERTPLAAIAETAGYRSASAFIVAFTRAFGCTPGVWRRGEADVTLPAPRTVPEVPVASSPPRASSRLAEGGRRERDAVHSKDWAGPWLRIITCGEWRALHVQPLWLQATEPAWTVVVTRGGTATLEIGGDRIRVRRGTVVIYPEPVRARWRPVRGQPWQRFGLRVAGARADGHFHLLADTYGLVRQVAVGELRRRFTPLLQGVRGRRELGPGGWSRLAYRWLVSLEEALARGRPLKGPANWPTFAAKLPGGLYRRVADYAHKLGYSRSHTQAHLKRLWNNQPPGRALREQRLEQAAQWLREGREPVAVVGRRAGYRSNAGFIGGFKRHYGTTPARYRRAAAGGVWESPPPAGS